nr:hypothetical protein CFP56_31777 [Quercus suber]
MCVGRKKKRDASLTSRSALYTSSSATAVDPRSDQGGCRYESRLTGSVSIRQPVEEVGSLLVTNKGGISADVENTAVAPDIVFPLIIRRLFAEQSASDREKKHVVALSLVAIIIQASLPWYIDRKLQLTIVISERVL